MNPYEAFIKGSIMEDIYEESSPSENTEVVLLNDIRGNAVLSNREEASSVKDIDEIDAATLPSNTTLNDLYYRKALEIKKEKKLPLKVKEEPLISYIDKLDSTKFTTSLAENLSSIPSSYNFYSFLKQVENEQIESKKGPPKPLPFRVVDFLFGPDMAIFGLSLDQKGFDFSVDRMMMEWSEHPVMSTFQLGLTLASVAFPLGGTVSKSLKVGRLARFFTEAAAKSGKSKGIIKKLASKTIYERFRTTDKASIITKMAIQSLDETDDISTKFFDPEVAKHILDVVKENPEKVTDLVPWHTVEKMLLIDYRKRKIRYLLEAVESDPQNVSPLDKARYVFHKRFSNEYFYIPSRINEGYIRRINELFRDYNIPELARNLPDEDFSLSTYAYIADFIEEDAYKNLLEKVIISNVTKNKKIGFKGLKASQLNTKEGKQLLRKVVRDELSKAKKMKSALIRLQLQMLDEGFITEAQYLATRGIHVPALLPTTPNLGQVSGFNVSLLKIASGKSGINALQAPPLTGPTLWQRKRTLDEIKKDLLEGKIATHPKVLLVNGLIQDQLYFSAYRTLRDLILGFYRGDPKFRGLFIDEKTYKALPSDAARHWISLADPSEDIETLYGREVYSDVQMRLRNMVSKALGGSKKLEEIELPYIHRSLFKQIFSEEGMLKQIEYVPSVLDSLNTIHKIANTALNPASHGNNFVGTMIMLAMAEPRYLVQPRFWENMSFSGHLFFNAAKFIRNHIDLMHNEEKGIDVIALAFSENNIKNYILSYLKEVPTFPFRKTVRELIEKNPDVLLFSDKVKNASKYYGVLPSQLSKEALEEFELDIYASYLASIFSSPQVRSIIDESAFEAAEGFLRFKTEAKKLASLPPGSTGILREGLVKMVDGLSSAPVISDTLNYASSLYLAEDVIPKSAYLMSLLQDGWSLDTAIMEVGRRLPQYATIGKSFKTARRLFYPWLSFPVEAARILKNNIQDYPFRTAVWLQVPGIVQSILSETGLGPETAEKLDLVKEGLKRWAVKPTSVIGASEAIGKLSGSTAGATVGLFAGTALAPRSSLPVTLTTMAAGILGAYLGGKAGAFAAELETEDSKKESQLRSWVMDFLPFSALYPSSTSKFAEPQGARDLIEILPIQPLAIVKDIFDIITGQSGFGEEIPVTGLDDAIGKMALQFVAFVSPTWVQKYGMKFTAPDGTFLPTESLFGFDIKLSGPVGAAGGALLGAKVGSYAGPVGAGVGGLIGALAGSKINMNRLFVEMGLQSDPNTGKPGNPIYDIVFNSFLGVPKTYGVDPKIGMINEEFRNRRFERTRTAYTKNLRAYIENENYEAFMDTLLAAFGTFTAQYVDPTRAQTKYEDWLRRNIDVIARHPALKSMSKEELIQRLARASRLALETRTAYARDLINGYRQELVARAVEVPKKFGIYVTAPSKKQKRRRKRPKKGPFYGPIGLEYSKKNKLKKVPIL